MNARQLIRTACYRIQNNVGDNGVKYELGYLWRQAKPTFWQHAHFMVEAHARVGTSGEKRGTKHEVLDYPDPAGPNGDYHTVIGCMCGKEFS